MAALAVLIDGENIPARRLPDLIRHIATLGDPIVKCVFGDFSESRLSAWISAARDHCLEVAFQVSGGKGKNSADIAMTIRAMDLLHEKRFDVICLASSDRDFRPLALRLKTAGIKVYGFGNADAQNAMRGAFTDFFHFEAAPVRKKRSGAVRKPPASEPPVAALHPIDAFSKDDLQQLRHVMAELADPANEGWLQLPRLAAALRNRAPDLAARLCGKGKFLKHLRACGVLVETGTGSSIKVRLKSDAAIAKIAA